MNQYTLSIIIPAYNCERYIRECIRSVLDQLPDNAELVVVDDGSSDSTRDILAEYEGVQENVTVFYNEHKGASGARNKGLDLARGEFVSFLDCDDCLHDGFLEKALPLTAEGHDLYIFGIERRLLTEEKELWTVNDHSYANVSDFADEYIRIRKLLIYSNCNKFYRKSIIDKHGIRFEESMDFGEDRIFNFVFLKECGGITTSSLITIDYIQRSLESQSGRHIPGYFDIAMYLHDEKMKTFLNLSKGTTREEKLAFEAYDVSREIEMMIERFDAHPEERDENLPKINQLVFEGPYDMDAPVDIIIVAGSTNCEYRVEKALEIGRKNEDVRYIVSGGNPHISGCGSESEFMAQYLREHGVPEKNIYLETRAQNSRQNLELSAGIIRSIRMADAAGPSFRTPKGTGIVTGGFHVPRVRRFAEATKALESEDLFFFPAYGPNTGKENWYQNQYGRKVVLGELRKTLQMNNETI